MIRPKLTQDFKLYLVTVCITALVMLLLISFILSGQFNQAGATAGNLSTNGNPKFSLVQNCLSDVDQSECLNQFVAQYKNISTKELLAKLEAARAESTEIENSCHPVAHAIGRQTLDTFGNVGDAFEACDYTCHSGCYHGVMERMFNKDDTDSHVSEEDLRQKIPGICSANQFKNPTTSVVFQCLHGVGHAILYTLDYDLRLSLQMCDLLPTDYDQESCYGGVFMENVTAFEKEKRDLKPADLLYPCNSVSEKYQAQCYLMQTSVMLEFGADYTEMPALCDQADNNASQCYVSVGRDLSNFVRVGQVAKVVNICDTLKTQQQKNECISGAVYALIDNTWNSQYAYLFCDQLSIDSKSTCYQQSNSYLNSVYDFDQSKINAECSLYSKNINLCNLTYTGY